MKHLRIREILVLLYRVLLVFIFFQIARSLFWSFNKDLIKIDSFSQYFKLAYYGTAFDTTAILYVNSLFILLSLIPLTINTKKDIKNYSFGYILLPMALRIL